MQTHCAGQDAAETERVENDENSKNTDKMIALEAVKRVWKAKAVGLDDVVVDLDIIAFFFIVVVVVDVVVVVSVVVDELLQHPV